MMPDWEWDNINWYVVAKFAIYAAGVGLGIGTLLWPSSLGIIATLGWLVAAGLFHLWEVALDEIYMLSVIRVAMAPKEEDKGEAE